MNLQINISLQQTLSPQMQQSLALLQAPALELHTLVAQYLSQNPVLEEIDPIPDCEESQILEDLDLPTLVDSEEAQERHQYLIDSLTANTNFRDNLHQQANLSDVPKHLLATVHLIIDNLDDSGYLSMSLTEISTVPIVELQAALKYVQQLDPPGIGARDLRECLLLQLHCREQQESLEYTIVQNHLELLAKRRLKEIANNLGVYIDEVQDAIENISKLNPYPIDILTSPTINYVAADIRVYVDGENVSCELAEDLLPNIRLVKYNQSTNDPGLNDYLHKKFNEGKFLLRCLAQRKQTILRVAKEIIRLQKDFFIYGTTALKPMTMAQVAEEVGVHETTVSRAVAGKYMDTPQGLIEMRALFTSGVATDTGTHTSSTSVKRIIADLIKSEDPRNKLTDDQLESILNKQGVHIARRTVAKYRSELKIPPINLR